MKAATPSSPLLSMTALGFLALVSESIDSATTGSMQKMTYQEDWESDGSVMGTLPLPSPALQFSLAPRRNFTETLFIALLPNGTVMAVLDTGTFTPPRLVNFSGGPEANFSAIAMSEDAMFYGISYGEVLEYAADGSDAFTFVYVGRVFP